MKVFSYGILAAFLAVVFEYGFLEASSGIFSPSFLLLIVNVFVGVSFVEEFSKYIVVNKIAICDSEFDEPLDAMLYMVIVGLGFAALENILLLFGLGTPFNVSETLTLTLFRFLGATFLHALCSGTIGFFLALGIFEMKKKTGLMIAGLMIATFLHGLYNFSIMELEGNLKIVLPGIILLGLGIFVFFAFQKLKTIASVCKLK